MIKNVRDALRVLLSHSSAWETVSVGLSILLLTVLEGLGIGLVFPVIQLVLEPERVFKIGVLNTAYASLGFEAPVSFIIAMLVMLAVLFVVKNTLSVFCTYWQARYAFTNSAKLSSEMLRLYMRSPYPMHLRRDTAEMITVIQDFVPMSFNKVVIPLLTIITEAGAALAIGAVLIAMEPTITLFTGLSLTLGAGLFYLLFRGRYQFQGQRMVRLSKRCLALARDGLGSVKEARVLGREKYFFESYAQARGSYAKMLTTFSTLNVMPRAAIETLALLAMLSAIIFILVDGRDMSGAMAVFGLFAVAAIRLLPSASRIVFYMSQLRYGEAATKKIVTEYLTLKGEEPLPPGPDGGDLTFDAELVMDDISFSYPDREHSAVSHINLSIPRGWSVGLVGTSGAGKSTLGDMILGLLPPTKGRMTVDGKDVFANLPAWHGRVGYVPQAIHILNTTLRENIAFGLAAKDIDDENVRNAIRMAHLESVVEDLPDGLDTMLGEQGVRLSGGQRQRVGIARALYHDPELLVLDEATSALDSETEREITLAIEDLAKAKTTIIIAHRLSTVKHCDRLYFLKDGRVAAEGSFDEMTEADADFRRMVEMARLDAGAGA